MMSVWQVEGWLPKSPATMAGQVPWPMPVAERLPKSSTRMLAALVKSSGGRALMRCKKSYPASMGAMVWELEGPGPILKSSVMAVVMGLGIAPPAKVGFFAFMKTREGLHLE